MVEQFFHGKRGGLEFGNWLDRHERRLEKLVKNYELYQAELQATKKVRAYQDLLIETVEMVVSEDNPWVVEVPRLRSDVVDTVEVVGIIQARFQKEDPLRDRSFKITRPDSPKKLSMTITSMLIRMGVISQSKVEGGEWKIADPLKAQEMLDRLAELDVAGFGPPASEAP